MEYKYNKKLEIKFQRELFLTRILIVNENYTYKLEYMFMVIIHMYTI